MFRTREEILAEMLAQLQGAIPDIHVGNDGVLYITFSIEAGQFENAFLGNQLVLNDIFITTASYQALRQHGIEKGLLMKEGTRAQGTLQFEGIGGTYVGVEAEVGYDPGSGLDVIYFQTIADGTIPNPGTPTAPTVAINATAGNLNGTYEYRVTYLTASGETLASADSLAVNPASQQVNLSAIPLGGPGTTGRRIYRDKNGAGTYRLVATIANNTATTYTDNITDAAVAASSLAPTVDTAHRISIAGEAIDPGLTGNVAIGTITSLVNVPAAVVGVTNTTAFAGGSDTEDTEDFRARLLRWVRSPQSGAPDDLQAWAEAVDGVESATVFPNDNMGTPTNGHTTVRISGPGGTIPGAGVIADVLAALQARDVINVTIHVGTFAAVATNVTVDVTTSGTYLLADVTPSVTAAITDYVNGLAVGETLTLSGIVAVVRPLPGISDVVVTTPATNQTTTSTQKRVAGVITVT